MLYVFLLLDKPGGAELRQRLRPEHRAYVDAMGERVAFAGPITGDDGQSKLGSLFAIDFASREEAQAWLAREPYTVAGLYASTTVHAFVNMKPPKA